MCKGYGASGTRRSITYNTIYVGTESLDLQQGQGWIAYKAIYMQRRRWMQTRADGQDTYKRPRYVNIYILYALHSQRRPRPRPRFAGAFWEVGEGVRFAGASTSAGAGSSVCLRFSFAPRDVGPREASRRCGAFRWRTGRPDVDSRGGGTDPSPAASSAGTSRARVDSSRSEVAVDCARAGSPC